MLFTGWKPNNIAWADFLDRTDPTLRSAKAGRDDQRLTERMCMPGGACTRLEHDACATNTRRFRCLEYAVPGRSVDRPQSRLGSGE